MLFENFPIWNEIQKTVITCIPREYDYSHLVDRPVKPREESAKRPGFEAMLTEYDRILLKFGMHIAWKG